MDLSRYNITGMKEAAGVAAKNNRRLIEVRWIYMLLVAGVAIVTTVLSGGGTDRVVLYGLILAGGLFINELFYVSVRTAKTQLRTQRLLTFAQLVLDLAMAGAVTYIEGGATARTTVLFMFPILTAALIFRGAYVILAAALSGATYVGAVLIESYIGNRDFDPILMTVPLLFYPTVFLLFARIMMYLEHIGTIEAREKAYDSFLSMVAHQLKHPASAVTAIIDAMKHEPEALSATTLQYVTMLKAENENQIRLIDNLLEAAPRTPEKPHFEAVKIEELVTKVAERIASANERSSDLKKLPDSVNPTIQASSIKLGLAFTNIFDNAFRYSKPGELVQYLIEEKSGTVKLLIRDSGRSMSEDEITHQLERLTNEGIRGMENGSISGLGLGLFAVSQIIKAHHGHLMIHSGPGVGTTVIVTLPKEQ